MRKRTIKWQEEEYQVWVFSPMVSHEDHHLIEEERLVRCATGWDGRGDYWDVDFYYCKPTKRNKKLAGYFMGSWLGFKEPHIKERFIIREGEFGKYFYDTIFSEDLPLKKVKYLLNLFNNRIEKLEEIDNETK